MEVKSFCLHGVRMISEYIYRIPAAHCEQSLSDPGPVPSHLANAVIRDDMLSIGTTPNMMVVALKHRQSICVELAGVGKVVL